MREISENSRNHAENTVGKREEGLREKERKSIPKGTSSSIRRMKSSIQEFIVSVTINTTRPRL